MLDKIIFTIWDNFKDVHKDFYYSGGINTTVRSYFVSPNHDACKRHYQIFINENKEYSKRKFEIEKAVKSLI